MFGRDNQKMLIGLPTSLTKGENGCKVNDDNGCENDDLSPLKKQFQLVIQT